MPRISELATTSFLALDHLLAVSKDGSTNKITISQIRELLDYTSGEIAHNAGTVNTALTALGSGKADASDFDQLEAAANAAIAKLVSVSVDNTTPRFDGTTGKLQTSTLRVSDTGSVGLKVVPTGLLESLDGIAFTQAQSGIARDPATGDIHVIVNNVIILTITNAGGIVSPTKAIKVDAAGGHDIATVDTTRLTVNFIAKGVNVFASGQYYVDQTGGGPAPIFGRLDLYNMTDLVLVQKGPSHTVRTQGTTDASASMSFSLAYTGLTIGKTYQLRLIDSKTNEIGPILARALSIQGIVT